MLEHVWQPFTFVVFYIPSGRSEVEEVTDSIEAWNLDEAADNIMYRYLDRGDIIEVRAKDGAVMFSNRSYL